MIHSMARWTHVALGVGVLFVSTAALAEEEKVELATRVVVASNQGTTVDPQLGKMKAEFARQGISFTSWKQHSEQKVSLEKNKPARVAQMPTHDLWMAFFRDPDRNVLGLMSEVPRQ